MSVLRNILMFLFLLSGLTRADELIPPLFQKPSGTLFTMQGSNTIGARLGPELVAGWLEERGFKNVDILDTAVANEQSIVATHIATNKQVTVEVKAHGSSSGFRAMMAGNADIAAASRRIKKKERLKMIDFGDLQSAASEHVIGIDGIAVVVNPGNPVSTLSTSDIAKIFSGEIVNWNQVGGTDSPITVYARDNQSGTWDTFRKLVLGKKYKLIDTAQRFESNTVLSNRVTGDSSAIGFVSLNTIDRAKPLAVSAGEAQALMPERLTVATEDYALARRLYLYLPGVEPNAFASDFMSWAIEKQGQKVVDNVGYISQNVAPLLADVSQAPDTYKSLVEGNQRLSVNFRFHEGKARLDNKARQDVKRLAQFINENEGNLLLVGFAEGSNSSFSDLLSKLRAKVVRRALIRAGVSRKYLESHGYGRFMQLSDGNDMSARVKNRRVEVWFEAGEQQKQEPGTKQQASVKVNTQLSLR